MRIRLEKAMAVDAALSLAVLAGRQADFWLQCSPRDTPCPLPRAFGEVKRLGEAKEEVEASSARMDRGCSCGQDAGPAPYGLIRK